MKPYVNFEFEMDSDLKLRAEEKADEMNMSFNEYINNILREYIISNSKKYTSSQFKELLEKSEEKGNFDAWKEISSIVDDYGKTIAVIFPKDFDECIKSED
jgi:hypothetical protein